MPLVSKPDYSPERRYWFWRDGWTCEAGTLEDYRKEVLAELDQIIKDCRKLESEFRKEA